MKHGLPRNIVFALVFGCALSGVGPAAAAEGPKKQGTGAGWRLSADCTRADGSGAW